VAAAAASKDLPAAERPALVLHVVADGSVEVPANDTNLRALWWWGVLAPLDVAVLVDAADRDPVDAATIGEVARWDVELVSRLAERWDGDPATLAGHVAEHARPARTCVLEGPAGPSPGPATEAWCAGTVERWAGMLDPHVTLAPEGVLDRRRWHAQVTVVYPWLEEVRAVVSSRVAAAARSAGLDEESVDALMAEELGGLRHLAMFEHNLDLPGDVRDLLGRAVTARNELAHLRAISPQRLGGLRAAAARSGVLLASMR